MDDMWMKWNAHWDTLSHDSSVITCARCMRKIKCGCSCLQPQYRVHVHEPGSLLQGPSAIAQIVGRFQQQCVLSNGVRKPCTLTWKLRHQTVYKTTCIPISGNTEGKILAVHLSSRRTLLHNMAIRRGYASIKASMLERIERHGRRNCNA